MSKDDDRLNIPGYVSIKEAAKILGISANRVYAYVEEGRLPSAKAAHVIMIPLAAVEDFKPQLSGRPRTSIPVWRISPEENAVLATSMLVRIKTHQRAKLMKRLEEIRREKQHLSQELLPAL
jgi:excisionase family DNA binding protein